jgi:hypothetical protein
MELKIEDIDLLLPKKVPKHGKVSGIKSERGAVRVIIPKENTKLSLIVSEPSEVLARSVTPDGKILGLTNFIGKNVYIIDQNEENFLKETGMVPLFDKWEKRNENTLKKLYEMCEKYNLDPSDLMNKAIEAAELKLATKEGEENE